MKKKAMPETAVDLVLWTKDGELFDGNDMAAPQVSHPKVSVGRTDSRRRLGFAVRMAASTPPILFTFDRVQVTNLRDLLTYQLRRLKK